MLVIMLTKYWLETSVILQRIKLCHTKQARHLQMKLAYLLWKLVQKIQLMWNRLSWPWLLPSRTEWQANQP
ncbi:hypothetical protein Gorai_014250 [Gossypium raimondii]|uniref:Uncharacterized protein n=1 Tax=Gossypium raimondii TaxID=29730 RepID=A0A7J8P2C2_GOSRA|nr:hypothetical protein [Gossypium raimondii]